MANDDATLLVDPPSAFILHGREGDAPPGRDRHPPLSPDITRQILDAARWAPSGDNTQPWRFETLDARHVVVHGRDTRDHCVYDLAGAASQIALGALLETISVAASAHGLAAGVSRRCDAPADQPTFDVRLAPTVQQPDALADYIEQRVTQRRPMGITPLTNEQRRALEAALPPGFRAVFLDGWRQRWRIARLLYRSARIRLTTPEAFETHRRVIQWNARTSEDRIPDMAVGVDPVTRRVMRWTLQSWRRVRMMNRFFAGTVLPRVQLDLLPGFFCAAHFFLVAQREPASTDDFIAAGRALQRFWLTAAQQGLLLQPEMTPLIFSQYARAGVRFTAEARALSLAAKLNADFGGLLGDETWSRVAFMGRLGAAKQPASRSTRLPLSRLMLPTSGSTQANLWVARPESAKGVDGPTNIEPRPSADSRACHPGHPQSWPSRSTSTDRGTAPGTDRGPA